MKPINNTLFLGKVLIELDDSPSTNMYAHELLSKNRPIEGTAIIAHNQYQGKGQYGKKWISESGKNLTLSVILYPDFLKIEDQFYLNKLVCIALVEFLASLGVESKIKWPNDIYHENLKLGGVLIENSVSLQYLSSSILGIGLNINQLEFDSELTNPISVATVLGKELDLEMCVNNFLAALEKWYLILKNGDYQMLDSGFNKNLYRAGESILVDLQGKTHEAIFTGVERTGKIKLEIDDHIDSYTNHEIEIHWLKS
ncbi:MAG: biotin--[acetyl-CoA-carboxylase] ligase [Chitinophagales bacterium]|nr:biotin--[acetyl-CoA-carboxylase] ligase [Chitinophagales bacterium]